MIHDRQVARSMLGFAFPLFAEQMFKAMGLGGGNSLLAGPSATPLSRGEKELTACFRTGYCVGNTVSYLDIL